MMQLAMYKGRGKPGNYLTRWWTGSQYSHCELVIDGVCYSASFMDGGVRAKEIDLASGRWDVIDIPWGDKSHALGFFDATRGAGYDWLGILGSQFINRRMHNVHRWFCSEWVGCAIGLPHPETRSPETLMEVVQFLNNGGFGNG